MAARGIRYRDVSLNGTDPYFLSCFRARSVASDHEQHPRQSVMRAGELECFEIGSGSLDSASGPTWHATDVAEPLDVNESDASAISRIRSARWRDIPSRCGGELIRSRETMPVSIPATCTRRSAVSSSSPQSGFAAAFPVDDFALTLAERRLFEALDHHGVRYMLRTTCAGPLRPRHPVGGD